MKPFTKALRQARVCPGAGGDQCQGTDKSRVESEAIFVTEESMLMRKLGKDFKW